MVGDEMMRVVSSAKVKISESMVVEVMSFMYRRNSVVDRVLPWGIPSVMI